MNKKLVHDLGTPLEIASKLAFLTTFLLYHKFTD